MDFLDKNTWHRLGPPFANMAMLFKIRIAEEDIEYINNIIKKDKVYNLINMELPDNVIDRQTYYEYRIVNAIVFYEEYYNSQNCPKGVKQILFVYIGNLKAYLNFSYPYLLESRRYIVERWFEIVRNNS